MRIKFGVLMLCVTMLLASTAMAFDGQRKGFVLGGGVGLSRTVSGGKLEKRSERHSQVRRLRAGSCSSLGHRVCVG